MNEHELQASIIAEVNLYVANSEDWAMLFAVPNGGHRDVRVAKKLKAEGVRPGVPDILWPIARGNYVGLAMELKVGANKPTAEQSTWLHRLSQRLWYTCVVRDDPEEAMKILNWYYKGARQ